MFGHLHLLVPEVELQLHSKARQQIKNVVAPEPEHRHLRKYNTYRARHPRWVNRKPPCGRYNCYGHVFAARRTAVYPDASDAILEQLSREDGFREIPTAQATVGDIVLYKGGAGHIHAAEIVNVSPGNAERGELPAIYLLSKWDDTAGEDVHILADVPFPFDSYVIWTERER